MLYLKFVVLIYKQRIINFETHLHVQMNLKKALKVTF